MTLSKRAQMSWSIEFCFFFFKVLTYLTFKVELIDKTNLALIQLILVWSIKFYFGELLICIAANLSFLRKLVVCKELGICLKNLREIHLTRVIKRNIELQKRFRKILFVVLKCICFLLFLGN